jgi:hypothetical protein
MILKCAEAHALRKTFPQKLAGLYVEEEMSADYSIQNVGKIAGEDVEEPEPKRYTYAFKDYTSEQGNYLMDTLIPKYRGKYIVLDESNTLLYEVVTTRALPKKLDAYKVDAEEFQRLKNEGSGPNAQQLIDSQDEVPNYETI